MRRTRHERLELRRLQHSSDKPWYRQPLMSVIVFQSSEREKLERAWWSSRASCASWLQLPKYDCHHNCTAVSSSRLDPFCCVIS